MSDNHKRHHTNPCRTLSNLVFPEKAMTAPWASLPSPGLVYNRRASPISYSEGARNRTQEAYSPTQGFNDPLTATFSDLSVSGTGGLLNKHDNVIASCVPSNVTFYALQKKKHEEEKIITSSQTPSQTSLNEEEGEKKKEKKRERETSLNKEERRRKNKGVASNVGGEAEFRGFFRQPRGQGLPLAGR